MRGAYANFGLWRRCDDQVRSATSLPGNRTDRTEAFSIASNKSIFFPPNKGRHGVKAGFINRYSIKYSIEVLTGRFSRATHPNTDHIRCCLISLITISMHPKRSYLFTVTVFPAFFASPRSVNPTTSSGSFKDRRDKSITFSEFIKSLVDVT
jgi:hypothetical protein